MTSLFDLLQQKPSYHVVKSILKNGKANWKDIDISVFQFFVDVFGKNFVFTEEHYDDINEKSIDFGCLAFEIYESANVEEESIETKLKEFINALVNESFIAEYLNETVVMNWVTFLAAVVDHKEILTESKMKANANLMLTFLLTPFMKIVRLFDNPEVDLSDEMKSVIEKCVKGILVNMHNTFQYEKYAVVCAKEYSEILMANHEILLQDTTHLRQYYKMLLYDHRPLLSHAIKGIEDLCKIDTLKDVMREFLFTSLYENEDTVVQIIIKLINYKNLRHEVLGCLKAIAKIRNENENVISNNYNELFLNLLSKSKKTIAETVELMVTLEVDFWYELIKILNHYTTDDDMDIKLILTSIPSSLELTDPHLILDVVLKHTNQQLVSRRAAEIYNELFEMCYTKEDNIASLIDGMRTCTCDEITFVLLLQSFISIDNELLITFLRENVNYLTRILMPTISNAFLDYHKPNSLNLIVAALKKLYVIEPITILPRVRDIANGLYDILMSLGGVEFTEREKLVPKFAALLECKSWRLLNDNKLVQLYNFSQKHCTNIHYKHFPQFQRFYVNLLKHFWMLLTTNKSFLIEDEKFIKETKNIYTQILIALKGSKNSISDNCLMLSSLIDLYILFQPKMIEKSDNNFFKNFNIQLSKEEFIRLIDSMESNLFPETDDSSYYQQMLMQSFVVLFKNYINLPSLTSWEGLLKYYNAKSLYKNEIEIIMAHAIEMKKSIFEKSVAFAILNITNMDSLDHYRAFLSALNEFMKKSFPDYKQRNIVYGLICSIILERFSPTISSSSTDEDNEINKNRLVILDYVLLIIKNSDQSFSKNLLKFIKINENLLTDLERRKLNNFKATLLSSE